MPTFTTILKDVPAFGQPAYTIHAVVHDIEAELLSGAPRGAKCRRSFALVEKDMVGWFLVATITLQNMKGTLIDRALVISEHPERARQQRHAWGGPPITCKNCGSDKFYDIDRSLDYNHHQCAGCGEPAQTITESGASA